jgi:hypothetical protein
VYSDAGDSEPREWVYVLARVEGAILVLVSMVGLFRVATAEGGAADEAVDETDAASTLGEDLTDE